MKDGNGGIAGVDSNQESNQEFCKSGFQKLANR